MSLRFTASSLALLVAAACSQGGSIASPGATGPTTPPPTGGGGGGNGGGSGSGATCPTGFSEGAPVGGLTTCDVSGTLLANTTLPYVDGVAYRIAGRLNVGVDTGANGTASSGTAVDLTIEPGVVLFGSSGSDFVVVNRGSRILADGTEAQPIIFTSEADLERQADADPANDLGRDNDAEWGGMVLLGSAPINRCITGSDYGTDSCEQVIEGVSAPNAVYGGDDFDDDSGILRYVQVKFAGFEVSPGNELNGISFGGVGDSTIVDYVQVYNNSDDGVEFFGGTVNAKHLVLVGNDDESIDTDNGYQGGIQYALVWQTPGRGDNVTEQSSVAAAYGTLPSNPKIANFTFIGDNADEVFKSNSGSIGQLTNGVIVYNGECIDWDVTAGDGDNTVWAGVGADPSFQSVLFDCGNGGGGLTDDTPETPAAVAAVQADANNVYDLTDPANVSNSLIGDFINGPTESGVTAFGDESSIDPFFMNVDYIGAVENANDTWWQGWACGIGTNEPC